MEALKKKDLVGRMMDFEQGNLNEDETIELFQELFNTGLVWQLQGFYGRIAKELYMQGLIHAK